jgi:hypothetical protein
MTMRNKAREEVSMWSVTKKAVLLAAGLVMFAGGTASAATVDVKVPFSFIVQGRSMPAGQYQVQSDSMDPSVLLIRGANGTNAGMFVLTRTAAGHDPAGDTPALTFDRYENQYRLVRIWESAGQGQELEFAAAPGKVQPKTAKHISTHAVPMHATKGVVKSVDASTLVITRTGKKGGEMTFAMNPDTHSQGTVAVGTPVAVRYREEGKTYVATAITAQQPKQRAAHAAASKP